MSADKEKTNLAQRRTLGLRSGQAGQEGQAEDAEKEENKKIRERQLSVNGYRLSVNTLSNSQSGFAKDSPARPATVFPPLTDNR
jgi:hypothetical protein